MAEPEAPSKFSLKGDNFLTRKYFGGKVPGYVILLVVGVGGYFLYQAFKPGGDKAGTEGAGGEAGTGGGGSPFDPAALPAVTESTAKKKKKKPKTVADKVSSNTGGHSTSYSAWSNPYPSGGFGGGGSSSSSKSSKPKEPTGLGSGAAKGAKGTAKAATSSSGRYQ